jgi:hypothetical protein
MQEIIQGHRWIRDMRCAGRGTSVLGSKKEFSPQSRIRFSKERDSPAEITRIAGLPFTGHLNSQIPQPTHFLRSTLGSCTICCFPSGPVTISLWKTMALGEVGQCSSHTMQGPFPDQGRHLPRSMYAEPMTMGVSIFSVTENLRMAPVGQTSPHKVHVYSQ